jgi:excisionase family DNA binding protein
MTTHSTRGRWQRVLDARRRSRAALGREAESSALFRRSSKEEISPIRTAPIPFEQRPNESINVMTLGEAAARLGVCRAELEAMIAVGKIEALPTGFTRRFRGPRFSA